MKIDRKLFNIGLVLLFVKNVNLTNSQKQYKFQKLAINSSEQISYQNEDFLGLIFNKTSRLMIFHDKKKS